LSSDPTKNIANINESRILIVPSAELESFTKIDAFYLTEVSYHSVSVESIRTYSVKLPPTLMDVNGNPIEQGKDYVIKILMMGSTFNQLSLLKSNKINLSEQGIYNGYYEGVICYTYRIVNMDPSIRNSGRYRNTCTTFGGQFFVGSEDNYLGRLGSMGISFSPEERTIRITGE